MGDEAALGCHQCQVSTLYSAQTSSHQQFIERLQHCGVALAGSEAVAVTRTRINLNTARKRQQHLNCLLLMVIEIHGSIYLLQVAGEAQLFYAYDWLLVAGGGPGLGKAKHSAPLLVFANTSRITQH